MKNAKIKSGASIGGFLGEVISKTLVKDEAITEADDDKQALASGDIATKDVIEKLNIIRSGRSLKDEDVKLGMEKYVAGLDVAEKTALFSFLKGISEIVTAGVPAEQAAEPSDKPSAVKMEKKPSQQKVSIKPNVVKKPEGKKISAKSQEDTTPPIKATPKK